jgi:CTP:molybdopterin cytidylyltransferase MocA/HD superfamily phosphodiesterase
MADSALHLSAIIPAAGMSTRFEQYKPLLKLGSYTLIEKVILLFRQCGIEDIIVVTGHNNEMIEPQISQAGAKAVFNPNFKTGMLSSIQTGVRALSPLSAGFFLLPADIPLIRPATIHALMASFADISDDLITSGKIIIPKFDGEDGHPPLIPARLIPEILSLGADSNLGHLISRQRQKKIVQVHDRAILMDADTQSDYERLQEKYNKIDIPDRQECLSIINAYLEGEETIKAHLQLVAETSLRLAEAVGANQAKQRQLQSIAIDLDCNLIMAGALLHDIKRKEKNHADAGAQLLLSLGFPKVADIISQHIDLATPLTACLTEEQVVYFADKICNSASQELDYERRFKEKMEKNPEGRSKILRRHENTRHIQARIEAASGRSIQSILG